MIRYLSQILIPFITIVIFMMISVLPFPIPYWSSVPPQLALIAVFYWSIYQPTLLPFWCIFLVGLIQDSLMGFPLGITSFLLILLRLFIVTQNKYFAHKDFVTNWLSFIILCGTMFVLLWLLMSVLTGHIIIGWAILFQYLITIIIYPFFIWILHSLQKNLVI